MIIHTMFQVKNNNGIRNTETHKLSNHCSGYPEYLYTYTYLSYSTCDSVQLSEPFKIISISSS